MPADLIKAFERMAQYGTAPEDGCSRFGVGYENAFERLKARYLIGQFSRGDSSEKFVVGPYGAGKTHFLRQLMEIGRAMDCVTSEVMLNKNVDFTRNLDVYRRVAAAVRCPESDQRGIPSLFRQAYARVQAKAGDDPNARRMILEGWVRALTDSDFNLASFARVARRALDALSEGADTEFEAACRWLEGNADDKAVARAVGESPVGKSESNSFGRDALFSLFQLIKRAGYRGTILGFDEAEQGLWADRQKTQRMLSQLQADINAIADLKDGSALVVFAVTPDLIARMEEFAALQQRVADAAPGQGFFDGNDLAAKIDLTTDRDPIKDLRAIGRRLVDLYFAEVLKEGSSPKLEAVRGKATQLADAVAATEASTSSRRTMARQVCTMLLNDYGNGSPPPAAEPEV